MNSSQAVFSFKSTSFFESVKCSVSSGAPYMSVRCGREEREGRGGERWSEWEEKEK